MLYLNGRKYLTDNDLKVSFLGFWPGKKIKNKKLREIFKAKFGRTSLGGDELISYAQPLVSKGMNFDELELTILNDIENPENPEINHVLFNKTATGIGRGHSLGGLSGIVFGIHGTKMIDSALTGLCASRSLVTSSRRRETGSAEIVIPESLRIHPDLLKEYMQVSEEVFSLGEKFKEKFGKMNGIETFNKVIPYNNPADLFIVLPLDTMATIISEVREDRLNTNGNYLPREIWTFADNLLDLSEKVGQRIMLSQRIEVPRDTYLHYNVFKDPSLPNYALEKGIEKEMSIYPEIVDFSKDFSPGFINELEKIKKVLKKINKITNAKELHSASMKAMYLLRNFSGEYNEAIRLKIADTLSWRVWSEQKRHSTLKQNVESVYNAAKRASNRLSEFWPTIVKDYKENNLKSINNLFGELEKIIVIDERIRKKPEVLLPYVYYTARQLKLYKKFLNAQIPERDALYIVPKNIRVRTLENYDLINLINLEFPLRLCGTCEPERQTTSWEKRKIIVNALPELSELLKPKCNIGFCTEGKPCKYIKEIRRDYSKELHKATKKIMLEKSKNNLAPSKDL